MYELPGRISLPVGEAKCVASKPETYKYYCCHIEQQRHAPVRQGLAVEVGMELTSKSACEMNDAGFQVVAQGVSGAKPRRNRESAEKDEPNRTMLGWFEHRVDASCRKQRERQKHD